MRLYYFFAIISTFLQLLTPSFFLPAIVVLLAYSKHQDPLKIYLLSFLMGILMDLLSGRTLGLSSLFLLMMSMVLVMLNQKFRHLFWVILGVGLSSQIGYFLLVSVFGF